MKIFKEKCKMCHKSDCPNLHLGIKLGTTTPCVRLKITPSGNYGIGTTAPTTYIQLNAKNLRDAWRKLISLTCHILLEKVGIKYTMFD